MAKAKNDNNIQDDSQPKKKKGVPVMQQTREQHAEYGRLGGIARGKQMRRARELRDIITGMLNLKIKTGDLDIEPESMEEAQGKNLTIAEVMVLKQLEKAINGDTSAFVVLRDSAGMKPAAKQEITATFENSPLKGILDQLKEDNEENNDNDDNNK